MTDKQADLMISILEKIEKHLQAIDWKFWDLHQQFDRNKTTETETPVETVTVPDELEVLAEIVSAPAATAAPVKQHTLKYPSIEILK
jgi:hypothetical protein